MNCPLKLQIKINPSVLKCFAMNLSQQQKELWVHPILCSTLEITYISVQIVKKYKNLD